MPRRLLCLETQPETLALIGACVASCRKLVLLHAPELDLLVELARRQRPEVLVIDADLTDLVPRALVKRLRAEPAMHDAPILVLGTDATPPAMTKHLEAGAFLYLAKPLQTETFLAALEFALEFAAAERAEL